MKLRASLKRKTVHVFRQKVKATKFVNIKYSKQTCRIFHDLIPIVNHSKIASSLLYMKRFSQYTCMPFKIEILLIPLLHAISHIFEISVDDHPLKIVGHARDHWWTLDFANAFVYPGVNSRGELVPPHGASRRRLGDNISDFNGRKKSVSIKYTNLFKGSAIVL
jgi:hypothetical protein